MTRTGFVTALVALVAASGIARAAPQTAASARTGTASQKQAAGKEAGEKEEAGEARLQLKDLPPAVRTTVEAETKNATLKGLSKEKANGKTVYEVESIVNGRTRDLMIDAAGKVYEVEEQLDIDRVPAPVKAALEAQGQIVGVESVMANGKVHYEGQVKTRAGKTVAVELDADGKAIRK